MHGSEKGKWSQKEVLMVLQTPSSPVLSSPKWLSALTNCLVKNALVLFIDVCTWQSKWCYSLATEKSECPVRRMTACSQALAQCWVMRMAEETSHGTSLMFPVTLCLGWVCAQLLCGSICMVFLSHKSLKCKNCAYLPPYRVKRKQSMAF